MNPSIVTETIPAWPLVVIAYGSVWMLTSLFLAWILYKVNKLQKTVHTWNEPENKARDR